MTSRDFRAIAAILADLPLDDVDGLRAVVVRRFADALATTNPRFDRSRFIAAATGQPLTPGDKPRARDFAR